MKKKASVSVVIPAYNAVKTIAGALDSVAAQNVAVEEIIVVDDGSQDETVDVVQRDYPSVRLLEQANQGPAAARNTGVRAASGDWIAFLDADDAWLPWRLELQLNCLEAHPEAIMFCGKTTDLNRHIDAPDGEIERKILALKDFAFANPVATTTVLLHRETFLQLGGFDERFRGPEDYELWMRVAATGTICQLQYPLARYRDEIGSLSRCHESFLPQVLRVLDKAHASDGVMAPLKCYRRAKAVQYVGASWMAFAAGYRLSALSLLSRSFLSYPAPLAVPGKSRFLRPALFAKYLTDSPS